MLFNSITYIIFFPIVTILYFLLPQKLRWAWLLGASYYFYASWNPSYLLLIIFTTILTYFSAIIIGESNDLQIRKRTLMASLSLLLGTLFVFKYFNFFFSSLNHVFGFLKVGYDPLVLNLLLPVGISFYTFQTLSYLIDVYRGTTPPEKHIGVLALYVSFFPQLVAGPIERSERLMPQFRKEHGFSLDRTIIGLKLMAWGFFLKLVIADRLAPTVNSVYNNPYDYSGLSLIVATTFFAFQIFGDFAGYSYIAIGSAKLMGFELMNNFDRPYFSKSISEFWRRWHISLSSWFKDYVYIPLGGSRVVKWRLSVNVLVVFLLSGLWHGAGLTFVIWGALHGLYLVFSMWTASTRKKIVELLHLDRFRLLHSYIQIIITFSLVCFAWIFFRANSVTDAIYIVTHLFVDFWQITDLHYVKQTLPALKLTGIDFALVVIFISVMESVHLIQTLKHSPITYLSQRPYAIRCLLYVGLVLSILYFGSFKESEFIYFQF